MRRFKPLSGIIFARTWMENRVGTANPAGFKPLSGIIFARTAPRSFGRMVGPFVSNPCRELSSRAPRANDIARHTQRRFQTPVGNYLRAHLCRVRVFVRAQQFQTPVGNYLRAHMSSAWTTHALLMFQTPVGNYLRAHFPKLAAAHDTRVFQTPVGNYLRAHSARLGLGVQCDVVSNPCRELSSRAQIWDTSQPRVREVSNPCRELSSRARRIVRERVRRQRGFKPLSGIIFARTPPLIFFCQPHLPMLYCRFSVHLPHPFLSTVGFSAILPHLTMPPANLFEGR